MKGIREAAMSKEEDTPESTWPKPKTPSIFSKDFDRDRYDRSYDYDKHGDYNNKYQSSYKTNNTEDDITITLTIPYSKLGVKLNADGEIINELAGETKATEIAYDRIEQLIGKNYESKYILNFDVSDNYYDSFEVEVTLTPNK